MKNGLWDEPLRLWITIYLSKFTLRHFIRYINDKESETAARVGSSATLFFREVEVEDPS